jgi:hypothetical protein
MTAPHGALSSVATIVAALLACACLSCGGSSSKASSPAPAQASSAAPSSTARAGTDALPSRPGRLWRRDVVAVLSRGLGDFLGRLEVQPAATGNKFHGWRIVRLREGDPMWQGTDLQPGDVVTAVNERPIERPEQAFAVFQNLAVAKELRVTYERGGKRRELFLPIDEDPAR